jgi:hypothetical protein
MANKRVYIPVMHVLTFTHKGVSRINTSQTPPRGGGEVGRWRRVKARVRGIRPISSSESALKVTYSNVGASGGSRIAAGGANQGLQRSSLSPPEF